LVALLNKLTRAKFFERTSTGHSHTRFELTKHNAITSTLRIITDEPT